MAKLARVHSETEASVAERADEFVKAAEGAEKRTAEAAKNAAGQLTDAARATARTGMAAFEAASERQRETAQSGAHELADLASTFGTLFNEQARDNLRFATALVGTTDWHEFTRLQREFLDSSFGRLNQAGERYRAALQAMFTSAAISSRS